MTAPVRVDRRAFRRREPAALATILVGQLTAYRCSTIYAPNATRLDAFVREEALPRLREQLDVRTCIVERWDKKLGPTVAQLVAAIHEQLELDPGDPDLTPLAALESALLRADRRTDRPMLLVLYRLEQLLDKKRDHAEVARFVDALARMAAMPVNGLHLVLGVKEEDLGAFRDLLRGRWRLLANDIRIKPGGKKWLLSLPLLVAGYVSANSATVVVAAAACAGTGTAAGAVTVTTICEDRRQELVACKEETKRLRKAKAPPPPVPEPEPEPPPEPATTTGTTTSDGTTGASTGSGSGTGTDSDAAASTSAPETTAPYRTNDPALDPALDPTPKKLDLCAPSSRDSACGKCVRAQCCADLQACKKPKLRTCVLKGRIGETDCLPETIDKECRKLALCALEYACRPDCFNN